MRLHKIENFEILELRKFHLQLLSIEVQQNRRILMSDTFLTPSVKKAAADDEIREQDRYLPTANISRIMKTTLPQNAKIAKDGKECLQECVSEFISFITSEASDKCQQEKRKTINGDDILWAMSTLGFDKYIEPLKIYLAKYRESVKGDQLRKEATSFGASAS